MSELQPFKKIFFPEIYEQFRKYFFRKTALADPILTLEWGFQLFWASFDLPVRVVLLKVALGLEKIDFWAFKKLSQMNTGQTLTYFDTLKCQQLNFP